MVRSISKCILVASGRFAPGLNLNEDTRYFVRTEPPANLAEAAQWSGAAGWFRDNLEEVSAPAWITFDATGGRCSVIGTIRNHEFARMAVADIVGIYELQKLSGKGAVQYDRRFDASPLASASHLVITVREPDDASGYWVVDVSNKLH